MQAIWKRFIVPCLIRSVLLSRMFSCAMLLPSPQRKLPPSCKQLLKPSTRGIGMESFRDSGSEVWSATIGMQSLKSCPHAHVKIANRRLQQTTNHQKRAALRGPCCFVEMDSEAQTSRLDDASGGSLFYLGFENGSFVPLGPRVQINRASSFGILPM